MLRAACPELVEGLSMTIQNEEAVKLEPYKYCHTFRPHL